MPGYILKLFPKLWATIIVT